MRRRRPAAQKRSTILRLGHLGRRPLSALAGDQRPPLKNSAIHIVTLLLAMLTFSLLVNFVGQVVLSARLESQIQAKSAEVAQLEDEIDYLRASVQHAESDVYVMQIAREQLFMAFPHDTVLLLQNARIPEAESTTAPVALPPPQLEPNWQQWWQAVFPPADPALDPALPLADNDATPGLNP
jgi:cell division protein FtsB